jgi:two-component system chemotaxis response regulator CheY
MKAQSMMVKTNLPVLVVDDYSTMFRIIQNMLWKLGFKDVDHATDGIAALSMLPAKRYGLIISDWNMQPMNGYDMLKRVRANPSTRGIPVIMVTAESKPENIVAAKSAGASEYVVKPFNLDTLKLKVASAFGKS